MFAKYIFKRGTRFMVAIKENSTVAVSFLNITVFFFWIARFLCGLINANMLYKNRIIAMLVFMCALWCVNI